MFVQGRYYFAEKQQTWFADCKIGGFVSSPEDTKGNFLSILSVGYSWGHVEMSLQYRRTKFRPDAYDMYEYVGEQKINSLNLVLGFRF